MFNNSSEKMKQTAKIWFALGVIVSFALGLGLIFLSRSTPNIPLGLAVILFGSFISWIVGLLLHSIGCLVENSDKTSANAQKIVESLEALVTVSQSVPSPMPDTARPAKWRCPACDAKNNVERTVCKKCGSDKPL